MLMEVETVWGLIDNLTYPLPPRTANLPEALDATLAQDAVADCDYPPFDRSAVDGYAIGADDQSETFTVIETIHAGESKAVAVGPGQAVRIMTGAELPGGQSFQVVMQEHTSLANGLLQINRRDANSNIRRRGEDFPAGKILVASGTQLTPVELATLASIGLTQPQITARPQVLHLTGGDEIVPADTEPGRGQIRDANSFLIRALLARAGVHEVRHAHLPDDLAVARERVAAASSAHFNMLLFSGGASVGERDFTAQILEELGFEIHCRQVNVRPGRPLIFATKGRQVAFGLPGNPVSHFACHHLFVKRAVARLMGGPSSALEKSMLAAPIPGKSNPRVTFWPAKITMQGATRQVTPVPWNSSGDLAALIGVNALIRIGGDQSLSETGELVDCLIL